MTTHSSTLAWRIPWMEEPGGLQSMRLQSWTQLSDFTFTLLSAGCVEVESIIHLDQSRWLFSCCWTSPCLTYPLTQLLTHPAAAAAKSLQSCPILCDPIDGSPPGSPVSGILQARTLECVAISFSNAWKWRVKVKSLSRVQLLATPWTAAHQAPPSMGFSRQEYWSGVPLPSPVNSP